MDATRRYLFVADADVATIVASRPAPRRRKFIIISDSDDGSGQKKI